MIIDPNVCVHCGTGIYASKGVSTTTTKVRVVNPGSQKTSEHMFTAPLVQVWSHSSTYDDLVKASNTRKVSVFHRAEPALFA